MSDINETVGEEAFKHAVDTCEILEEMACKFSPKKNGDDFVELDNSSSSNKLLESLNKLRKNKQFCDVILEVSSKVDFHEVHCHRAVVASVSPYLFEIFDHRLNNGTADRALTDQCKLPGEFDMEVFEALIEYAYTAKLELPRQKLRSAYLTAAKLKMAPVIQFCGSQLVASLTPENCLGIRAVLLQASASCLQLNQTALIGKLDSFIKHNINEVLKSAELSGLRHIQMELIQSTLAEVESTNERHLFKMLLDWLRVGCERDGSLDMDRLTEKVYMLYLNRDRTLHDCADIESGDARDSELVRDYKRLTKRLHQTLGGERTSQTQGEVPTGRATGAAPAPNQNGCQPNRSRGSMKMRNGQATTASNVPAKPKQFLYTRSDSSSSSDDEQCDSDFRIVATASTGLLSTMGLAIVQSQMVLLSVVRRLNNNHVNNTGTLTTSNGQMGISHSQSAGGSPTDEGSPAHAAKSPSSPSSPQSLNNGHTISGYNGATMNDLQSNNTTSSTAAGTANGYGGAPTTGQIPNSPQKPYQQLQQMSTLAAMTHQRCSMGVAELNGGLFVCGGYDRGECLRSVELLSLSDNRWTSLADMHVARARTNIASVDGLIYAVGGSDGSRDLASAEVFYPDRQRWESLAPLPVPRSHAACPSVPCGPAAALLEMQLGLYTVRVFNFFPLSSYRTEPVQPFGAIPASRAPFDPPTDPSVRCLERPNDRIYAMLRPYPEKFLALTAYDWRSSTRITNRGHALASDRNNRNATAIDGSTGEDDVPSYDGQGLLSQHRHGEQKQQTMKIFLRKKDGRNQIERLDDEVRSPDEQKRDEVVKFGCQGPAPAEAVGGDDLQSTSVTCNISSSRVLLKGAET
ncbi:influenza virus NS1A-binding proteinA-like [Tropilaelaps mercedesae]|uniref:Influenza virus NS1A-binding proteinA-like n=1 Tax=Tropilaelaps mercedesae TaxID=418985 RepID=A0A1V9XCD5_9ACAR|nr:influenza virus NS1A-binding proteinA-like [Tropilaelaps mercedesae]